MYRKITYSAQPDVVEKFRTTSFVTSSLVNVKMATISMIFKPSHPVIFCYLLFVCLESLCVKAEENHAICTQAPHIKCWASVLNGFLSHI